MGARPDPEPFSSSRVCPYSSGVAGWKRSRSNEKVMEELSTGSRHTCGGEGSMGAVRALVEL